MSYKYFLFILIFCATNLFAQKDLKNGFLVLETNDTLYGKMKNKSYYGVSKVKLYRENKRIKYSKSVISRIHFDTIDYIKSENGIWSKGFFIKNLSGKVNVYTYHDSKMLGGFDNDVNVGRLRPAIKFYCSDYPNLKDSMKLINDENIIGFVAKYNEWKAIHPESKSFFERHIHYKPLINLKLSFLLPGAGLELGLSDKFSVITMLKNEIGYGGSEGWFINPFINNQLRYYVNMNKRKAENKRTYKYSGNYICLVDAYFLDTKTNLIGLEYGWQRTIAKHWYFNVGVGAAGSTTGNQLFFLLYDLDFGYNF